MNWNESNLKPLSLVEVDGCYKHYKGNVYKVLAIATDTESLRLIVIYQDIEKGFIWCRPIDGVSGFCTPTEDGKSRFTRIHPQSKS